MTVRAGRSSAFDYSRHVRAGDVVTWPQGTGEPLGLTRRLVEQRHELPPLELFVGMLASATLRPEHAERFRMRALNGAGSTRELTAAGLADIVPACVSAVPGLVRSGAIRVDVVLLRARPHPRPGFFTVGVMADFVPAFVAAARSVIAEVDERLPVTSHDALVAAADIDVLLECDGGEILLPDAAAGEIDRRVAANVAALVPDGATIQVGVGGLPVAVCRALAGHRELGVHSGVISDVIVELVERGTVTNARKGIDAGRIVTGGLFGSRRLMDFADGNDAIEMRSAEYTHSQQVLARVRNLYAINSGIEVDLTGNVNSEVAGNRYLGAIGGQPDFVRGAFASPGGRAIIALPSTTADGRRSRIVASLEGRPITTPRADADLVVTEHGVADLRGRSFGERAERLRAVAHPDFRDDLAKSVRKAA
ncbi:MAG: acetyl-CoA hydrolase/transferase family protein [Burkholderiales bacterium]|nr:acetyl-CoA hydrolase/transferase family protein [Burkholderiales bacterium]